MFYASAQVFPVVDYPADYFRSPVGIPIALSGNFGELRTNHYHMGLDIRTNQRENIPVFAAADGYISRIKIERYGYGRAIYISHPNGFTTLYAHLNDFYPELNEYIKNVQYETQQWEQYLVLPPAKFTVQKGQFIANSGNTGGSQGPHLHFEIRDTKTDKNVNPLHFNLGISDHIAPQVYALYFYDRRAGTYQSAPNRVRLKGAAASYSSIDKVVSIPSPVISFGISAEDKTDRSFKFGIYEAELWVDDSLRSAFRMDDFSYDDSRYINAGIDFKTKYSGGAYIQHLSRLPGNQAPIFGANRDGIVQLNDTLQHTIKIIIRDVKGNTSNVNLIVKYQEQNDVGYKAVASTQQMIPNQPNVLLGDNLEAAFSDVAFYDTVPFKYMAQEPLAKNAVSKLHFLHNYTVPVEDSFSVKIKTNPGIPEQWRDRIVMQLVNERKKVAMKGAWSNDWLQAKFWDLGRVQLILDTIPPTLRIWGWKDGANLGKVAAISFIAEDESGELKNFRAELDGQWLMLSRKSDYFIHRFDERTGPGEHELKVWVTDEAGNVTEKTYHFTR